MDSISINNKNREVREAVICGAVYGVFYFAFIIILAVQDIQCNLLISSDYHMFSHYFKIFPRAIGIVSFAFFRHILPREKQRKGLLFLFYLVFLFSMLGLYFPGNPILMLMPFISSFSLGHIWGAFNYYMAMGLLMNPHRGKAFGIGSAAALFLQFFLQNMISVAGNIFFVIIVVVIFAGIIVLITRPPAYWVFENPLDFIRITDEWVSTIKHQVLLATVVLTVLNLLCIGFDVSFTISFASGSVNIYSYPRLFMALGLIVAGIFVDYKGGKYFPTVLFSVFLLSFFQLLMPYIQDNTNVFLSIYYFYAAFYVLFTVLPFWMLSGRTRHAAFFAGFGLAVSDVLEWFFSMGVFKLYSVTGKYPFLPATFIIFLIIALYLLQTYSGFYPGISETGIEEKKEVSGDSGLAEFMEAFSFTPREKEVAEALITSEKQMKELAIDFGISERSMYRYSKSIYEKSGVQSRNAFTKMYYKSRK